MRKLVPMLVLAVLLVGCGEEAGGGASTSTSPTPTASPGRAIKVVYEPPRSAADVRARKILRLGGLDGIAKGFSDEFVLPAAITVRARSGNGSPYYDPRSRTVILFYGFVNTTADIIAAGQPWISQTELGTQWAAVNDFILIHELGHAFVDVYDIPITGREEDAVDAMATVFFTDSVPGGAEYAFYAAVFFNLLQEVQGAPDAAQFADEHSLSVQRSYDIACAVAGSSNRTMRQIGRLGILPRARLARCPDEYRQKSDAWRTLLEPHLSAG